MRVISCKDGAVGGADDPVGCHHDHDHHHEKLPEITLTAPHSVDKSKLAKRAQNVLFRAARSGGKVLGGLLAGAVGGVAGAALGAVWGGQAGGGKLEAANDKLRETYGQVKVEALEQLQSPLTHPAAAVGKYSERLLGKRVGSVVGQAAGALMGAGLGLAGGALFSYRFFGSFAGIAAENMAKDAVGELPVHYHTEQILRTGYRQERVAS